MHTHSSPVSNIIPLRGPRVRGMALELGHRGQNCGITHVAHILDIDRSADLRTVARHVRMKIALKGFPPPISTRMANGTLDWTITPTSIWNRAQVDHWACQQRTRETGITGDAA